MSKLFREIKPGATWSSLEEDGYWGYTAGDVNPGTASWEYIDDITHIYLVEDYLIDFGIFPDYILARDIIDEVRIEKGWTGCSNTEKDIIITHYAYKDGDIDKVIYLMMVKGMTQVEAQVYLVDCWHKHHKKFVESCVQRWYYSKRELILRVYKTDIENFCNRVETPLYELTANGIRGSNYGDNNDHGIMDFMESTGQYAGSTGVSASGFIQQNFNINPGFTASDVVDSVKTVLITGHYNRYIDDYFNI